MKIGWKVFCLVPLCVIGLILLTSFPLDAQEFKAFDKNKVDQLKGGEKKTKDDVQRLFGKPVVSEKVARTEEGCVEMWGYFELLLSEGKTEYLWVLFDDQGKVCKVTAEKK